MHKKSWGGGCMTHSYQDKYCFSGRTLLLFYPPLCTNENIATHVLQLSANENITFICMFTQQHIIQEKKMAPIAINVISKYQTQSVELKNAIKKFHPKCVSLSGRGAQVQMRHVSLFARFFF